MATFPTSAFQLPVGSGQPITASYASDGHYAPSSGTVSQTVTTDPTTTTVTASSANPSVYGQAVTFTAAVAASAPGSGTPTGTVTFSDSTTTLGTGTLNSSGVASYTTTASQLPVGSSQSITASYASDGNYAGSSTSSPFSQTVTTDPTATTVTASSDPSILGQAVTFTATVAANAPGSGTPTGTVQFVIDGVNFGSPVAVTPGSGNSSTATITDAALSVSVSPHAVSAMYVNNDGNYAGSTSASFSQTVNADPTTTAVTSSSASASVYGQAVTFTATVTANAPVTGTPTGTVTFKDGTTPLGTGMLNSSGVATYTTSAFQLPVGSSQSIAASYASDGNYASSSGTVSQTVDAASTATTITSSPNTSTYGQSVTFTATVKTNAPGSGTPTGSVSFYDLISLAGTLTSGSTSVTGLQTETLLTGELVKGSDTVTRLPSTSGLSVGQTVLGTGIPAGTTINAINSSSSVTLSNSATESITQQSLAFVNSTSTLPSTDGLVGGETVTGTGIPSGAVISTIDPSSSSLTLSQAATGNGLTSLTFLEFLGTPAVTPSGGVLTATLSTSSLNVAASQQVEANYVPTGVDFLSSRTLTPQTVNQATTSTSVVASPTSSTQGTAVTFTATVAPEYMGGLPTGTVTFYLGSVTGTTLGTGMLSGGVASITSSSLPVGSDTIIAVYGGDANDSGSQGSTSETVNMASISTSSPAVGSETIIPLYDGDANDSSGQGSTSETLNTSELASISTSSLPVGSDTIIAVYGGDANDSSSQGSTSETVNMTHKIADRVPKGPQGFARRRWTPKSAAVPGAPLAVRLGLGVLGMIRNGVAAAVAKVGSLEMKARVSPTNDAYASANADTNEDRGEDESAALAVTPLVMLAVVALTQDEEEKKSSILDPEVLTDLAVNLTESQGGRDRPLRAE